MRVGRIESVYGSDLPEMVKRIVSNAGEAVFFDDGVRVLSYKEIIDARIDLHVEFMEMAMIPIADCGDNDFIVYHLKDKI